MAKRRKVANLLALAVLSTLMTKPMHPYEIASVLRSRGKERDMEIKWGSLYRVVQNLERYGLLRVVQSERQGGRPERTVYEITEEGRAEVVDWVRELVAEPDPSPARSGFKAGLSLIAVLAPDEVVDLLGRRVAQLRRRLADDRAEMVALAGKVPRLYLIETEYELTVLEAEMTWAERLMAEITTGDMPDLAGWREFHRTGEMPAEIVELAKGGTDPT